MNNLIEEQCRYLESMAARIGVEVTVTPNPRGDFTMKLKGSSASVRVSMEDRCEDFNMKAWKLLNGKRR